MMMPNESRCASANVSKPESLGIWIPGTPMRRVTAALNLLDLVMVRECTPRNEPLLKDRRATAARGAEHRRERASARPMPHKERIILSDNLIFSLERWYPPTDTPAQDDGNPSDPIDNGQGTISGNYRRKYPHGQACRSETKAVDVRGQVEAKQSCADVGS